MSDEQVMEGVELAPEYPQHSWSWKMLDPRGVSVLINMKADEAKTCYAQYEQLTDFLHDKGWVADIGYGRRPAATESTEPEEPPDYDEVHVWEGKDGTKREYKMCPIHEGARLYKRKWGGWTHQLDDDTWCRGEAKEGS
jgi:hypothetical protein